MSIQKSQFVPSFLDLKQQILPRNPNFQPATVLDTANRTVGSSINNPSWSIPVPVKGAYAVSLKSLVLPVSWPNVTSTKHFDVTYGQVTPFPGDFTLGIGRYSYNLYAGKITYTMANEAPIDLYQDDLVYNLLRWFSGAIESITINPSTGVWTWVWDEDTKSVTSTSEDVLGFFKIHYQSGRIWQSSSTVDLVGPKVIALSCSGLAAGCYVGSIQETCCVSMLCSCPVGNLEFGDMLTHEPTIEHISSFGMPSKFISNITLSVIDAATGQLLPLTSDWACELKFYVEVKQ